MHTGPRGPLLFVWCTHYVPTTSHQPLASFRTAPAPPRASTHLCAPLCTLPHTSVHLCAPPCTSAHLHAPLHNFCASLSRASHPYWTFHFDLGPLQLPGATQP